MVAGALSVNVKSVIINQFIPVSCATGAVITNPSTLPSAFLILLVATLTLSNCGAFDLFCRPKIPTLAEDEPSRLLTAVA